MINQYGIFKYRDPDNKRMRWAVLHFDSQTWYFAKRYGYSNAKKLCHRLINSAKGAQS